MVRVSASNITTTSDYRTRRVKVRAIGIGQASQNDSWFEHRFLINHNVGARQTLRFVTFSLFPFVPKIPERYPFRLLCRLLASRMSLPLGGFHWVAEVKVDGRPGESGLTSACETIV